MSKPVRVVHYINQFFGGIGGEEQAWIGVSAKAGPVGPGIALQHALGDAGVVAGTIICGDNHFSESTDSAVSEILAEIRRFAPDLVVAGPAFGAGRYGIACGQVCLEVRRQLELPALTSLHPENPAVDLFRDHVYILPAPSSALGMREATRRMAAFGLKLAQRLPIGPAEEDGYFSRGVRLNVAAPAPAAERAVAMLLRKVRGEPFTSELVPTIFEPVPPAPPLRDPRKAKVALVTESAVVPKGNPARLPANHSNMWTRWDITGVNDLTSETHESVHSGFDVTMVNQDPDRVVPLDALRVLQANGEVAEVYSTVFVTAGSAGLLADMRRMGQEMAAELTRDGVDAVVLTGT